MIALRAAIGVFVVVTLTACAGEHFSLKSSAQAPTNAPSCGLEFGGVPGARTGKIAPDGGCPGGFYMSRRWAMEGGALTITDGGSQLLAQFKPDGTRFEGQSTTGMPVTLAR
jgi:Protease inhibitor Inh